MLSREESAEEKSEAGRGQFMRNEQRKWLHEMESTPGKEAMKIVEITTKDVDYDINLVDKAATALEKTDFNLESSNLEIATATPAFTNHHPHQSAAINSHNLSHFQ
ncbi:hypothetical protein QTO34_012051, partial [Cnephaeus nilssonii]